MLNQKIQESWNLDIFAWRKDYHDSHPCRNVKPQPAHRQLHTGYTIAITFVSLPMENMMAFIKRLGPFWDDWEGLVKNKSQEGWTSWEAWIGPYNAKPCSPSPTPQSVVARDLCSTIISSNSCWDLLPTTFYKISNCSLDFQHLKRIAPGTFLIVKFHCFE